MNHLHTPNHSQSFASLRGDLVRRVWRGVAVFALACAGVGAAHAQRGPQREDQAVPHAERFQLPRDADNGFDQRAFELRQEQRRQAQQEQNQRNADNPHRNGRMTADERRDLRRQINEAGMDLYPNPPRH
jgi:hypothetical protein